MIWYFDEGAKMKNLNIIILACGFIFTHALNADISGLGIAQNSVESKKEALADLAQNIKSEVRSTFESTTTEKFHDSRSDIKISSSLPILGAEFEKTERELEVETYAYLKEEKVGLLYTNKLLKINSEIDSLLKEVSLLKSSSEKLKIYEEIFSLLKEYERYESVAFILNAKIPADSKITKSKIKIEMEKLNSNIDSVDMACEFLAKSFKYKNIFVYPPLLQNNTTVAEFGSIFQKEFKSKLSTVATPKDALYILVGEYTLAKNKMVLNYELLSTTNNEVLESKTISINPIAYKNLKVKPQNIDFDTLLNSGIITSSDLKVSLNSNRGSENLLFHSAEEVELFVKLNKMGYFYIVGYTQTTDGKFSYLLELQEGEGESKFVKFINADDASRWISLGTFEVEKPFGVESLQVIASNKKITILPHAVYDEKSGYYVISNDIKKALILTRGLKKKSENAQMSEDVINFTTVK